MNGSALSTDLIDLSRPKQTYTRAIKRLIMRLNIHEYLLSRVGWWKTILELLSWLDRISHNALIMLTNSTCIHIHPSSFLASKSCSLSSVSNGTQGIQEHRIRQWMVLLPVNKKKQIREMRDDRKGIQAGNSSPLAASSCPYMYEREGAGILVLLYLSSEITISKSNVLPAMSAIIISTMRLTMTPFFPLQYVDPLRPIMLSIVPRNSKRLDLGVPSI